MNYNIVVFGATLKSDLQSTVIINPALSDLSTTLKSSKKFVYHSIAFSVSNGSYAGTGVIEGNSTKVKSNNKRIVLDNASVVVTLTGSQGSITDTITISDSAQNYAKAV